MHNMQERIHSRRADSQGTSKDLLLDRTTKIRTRGVILLFLRLNTDPTARCVSSDVILYRSSQQEEHQSSQVKV